MNIAEIARLAGVSSAAVSRYFNQGYISDEKREAIRKVVEQTGYRPSMQAQTLRTKKTKLIGVILPRIDSASIGSMVAGILSVTNEGGYHLLLTDTQNNPQKELESLTIFNEKQVDGVILIATVFTSEHKQFLKQMSVPVVLAGQSLPGANCICHDDYHATYDLTKMFLQKGRYRLGYMGVLMQDQAAGYERYRGYCDAVKDFGLERLTENYVVAEGFTLDAGIAAASRLIQHDVPDGMICATDTLAVGAMQYLKSQKIAVPDEMWLAGHGDSSLSDVTTPTLTTVHYSYEECGALAGDMLLNLLKKGGEMAPREIKLGYSLIVKGSGG